MISSFFGSVCFIETKINLSMTCRDTIYCVITEPELSTHQYQDLAEFRRQIRRFLHFSEVTAKEHGIEAQQHQLLLAVRGLPDTVKPTIREIASRLFIQHHSAVELINRLEQNGAIARQASDEDKREVLIRLTPKGRTALRKLAISHRTELERSGPELATALNSVLRHTAIPVQA
jgi:DNA-binding MarR family transcriptional regulator